MHRCLELAQMAAGYVAPNPMVGAVLVHEGRIIGEGFHQLYGGPHAEVNCIDAVQEADRFLVSASTLYVSLEPCAHYGKTPPCADLIIRSRIPEVMIGCRDPFKQVDGKGIEKLQAAGVRVHTGILEPEALRLNKRFMTFHTQHRPYITLKWAQTANGKIANSDYSRVLISNEFTNRLVHQWRSEEAAIMVGSRTALMDDPALTNRLWKGPNPVRIVIDKELQLPANLQLFNRQVKTIVFNYKQHEEQENLLYYQVTPDVSMVHQVVHALYQLQVQSVLIEGGAQLLQSFIDEGYWDETRIITSQQLHLPDGLAAPALHKGRLQKQESLFSDTISYFVNPQTVAH
jgi:diaminohydroxyphosphoribosylaminopyrimidine deaminase / 5-amino-6-(5-phosphoribosylamino)uracil reductase